MKVTTGFHFGAVVHEEHDKHVNRAENGILITIHSVGKNTGRLKLYLVTEY